MLQPDFWKEAVPNSSQTVYQSITCKTSWGDWFPHGESSTFSGPKSPASRPVRLTGRAAGPDFRCCGRRAFDSPPGDAPVGRSTSTGEASEALALLRGEASEQLTEKFEMLRRTEQCCVNIENSHLSWGVASCMIYCIHIVCPYVEACVNDVSDLMSGSNSSTVQTHPDTS